MKEFIVKQTQLDTFEIEYVSEKELNSNQILEIEKAIRLYLEDDLNFIFTRKDKLQRSKK